MNTCERCGITLDFSERDYGLLCNSCYYREQEMRKLNSETGSSPAADCYVEAAAQLEKWADDEDARAEDARARGDRLVCAQRIARAQAWRNAATRFRALAST